jgi:hypothetical protein
VRAHLVGLCCLLLTPGCLLDWDRDGLTRGEDCDDLDAGSGEPTAWYVDEDGDGYGSPEYSVRACTWPAGWVSNSADCDDSKAAINPDASDTPYDGDDTNCDGYNDYDRDRDGFVASGYQSQAGGTAPSGGDCNDDNPAIYPGAEDTWYDGVDSNCGGNNDYDQDGDGYSHESEPGIQSAYVDCDDTDASIQPFWSEDCSDGVDTDCDGLLDQDHLNYPDGDGDGYGGAGVVVEACEPPEGYADNIDDCDDDDPDQNPGASEICGNGIDENCTGEDRPCTLFSRFSLAEADGRILGEQAGGGAGGSLAALGDTDSDGVAELLVGGEGAAWRVEALLEGGVTLPGDALATWIGSGSLVVAAPGDFTGDGAADLLVASPSYGGSTGRVWLASGVLTGERQLSDAALIISGGGSGDGLGAAIAAGDLVGGGARTLALGAPGVAPGGAVQLAAAPLSGSVGAASLKDGRLLGEIGDRLGAAVAVADIDGDGVDDLLAGGPSSDDGGEENPGGVVYLVLGPLGGELDAGDADARFWAESDGDAVGAALTAGGDVDGDGAADFLVGAPGQDSGQQEAGAVYLITDPGSTGYNLSLAAALGGAKLLGERADDAAGAAAAIAGDLDGDGRDEIAVGAPAESAAAEERGVVYLLRGPVQGTISLSDADARLTGAEGGDRAGASLAAAGDLSDDGLGELAVGAPGASTLAAGGGEIYLLLGSPAE